MSRVARRAFFVDDMDIDMKHLIFAALFSWSLSSCCTMPQKATCSHFKSFSCAANATYECYMPIPDSCTLISTAEATKVEPLSLPGEMLSLAENLVYAHLRSTEASKKASNAILQDSDNGMRALVGTTFGNHSRALPADFAFSGILCSEYDVKAVPFKIVNDKEHVLLEEVMVAFYHKGQFCFALYVLLNDCSVSLDFKRGTKSFLLLYNIATYPFLDHNEYWIQRKRIMEGERNVSAH